MQSAGLTYAPNISWLFPKLPFRERLGAVAELGFTSVEFGFPSHSDLDALESAHHELGMQIVLFNQDVPVWDRANRGYLVDPKRRDEFRRKLDQALEIASRLEASKVMLPAGVELPEMSREAQQDCMIENLLYAAPLAAEKGVLLTIEVLNPIDNPGYILTSTRQAVEIVRRVGHPQVRFQFDTYHLQMLEGNLVDTIRLNSGWIGHIQFADYPGRHEPGTGSIDFQDLLAVIASIDYQGPIGLEYLPLAQGGSALEWAPVEMRS